MTDIETIPTLEHAEAMRLGAAEYDRFGDLLADLRPDEWATPVPDCPAWDVRRLVAHVVGGMAANASMRENARQLWKARHGEGNLADRLSALQVDDRADRTGAQLLDDYQRLAPKAITGRTRTPGPVRRLVKIPLDGWWGHERRPLGYLIDRVYLRDTWMHRVDVSRVLDRHLVLTPDHDGRIVADVVADWARRHGRPVTLRLTGPAGGTFTAGDGGEVIELDAVEFCRTVAARVPADGLLETGVPF